MVPTDLRRDVESWASGWLSTEVDENGVRVVRKGQHANDNHASSRTQRWARLVHASLVVERGRKKIAISDSVKSDSKAWHVTDDMFSATNEDESKVEKSFFESIMDDRDSYPHQSTDKYHQAGLRWMAYLKLGSYKEVGNVCNVSSMDRAHIQDFQEL
jgi:hypothetical protein